MKRLFFYFVMAGVIQPWLSGATAQADLIPWSISSGDVMLNPAEVLQSSNFGQNGTISIGSTAWGNPINGASTQSIAVASIGDYFRNPAQDVLRFGGVYDNYSLKYVLTDLASGDSAALTISGNLSGTISMPSIFD